MSFLHETTTFRHSVHVDGPGWRCADCRRWFKDWPADSEECPAVRQVTVADLAHLAYLSRVRVVVTANVSRPSSCLVQHHGTTYDMDVASDRAELLSLIRQIENAP